MDGPCLALDCIPHPPWTRRSPYTVFGMSLTPNHTSHHNIVPLFSSSGGSLDGLPGSELARLISSALDKEITIKSVYFYFFIFHIIQLTPTPSVLSQLSLAARYLEK